MKTGFKKTWIVILTCLTSSVLWSQQLVNLTNHWTAENIVLDNGVLSLSKTSTNGWVIEKTTEEKYVRIKNAITGTYLHTQNGALEAGKIGTGWYSAQWTLIPVGAYMQIVNRWSKTYINNERGKLEATALGKPGWLSAQWILAPTNATLTSTGEAPYSNNSVGGKLVGTWIAYDDIGRAATKPAKMYYSGSTLMIDNGQGSKSVLMAVGGLVKAVDWNMPGTIATKDASILDWTNGKNNEGNAVVAIGTSKNLIWVKTNNGQMKPDDVPITTQIPNLIGFWTVYNNKNVKQQNNIYITQHLYKIKYKEESGRYGVADINVDNDGTIIRVPLNPDLGILVSTGAMLSTNGKKITWDDGRYWVKN